VLRQTLHVCGSLPLGNNVDDPVLRVQSQLTARDRALLSWLYDHGVLTTFQVGNALFPSLDFCQRRLRTLYQLRLIARFRPQRADGGSYPYHWVIDQLGAEVVAAGRDQRPPRRDHARAERRRWTSTRSLAHRLGVNQFFTDLAGHARIHPRTELRQWLPEAACRDVAAFAGPDVPPMARAYPPRIRPDGFGVWAENGRQVAFFLEYDTGTEPLAVLTDKLSGYHALFHAVGRAWPVLFWLHSTARERHLRFRLNDLPTMAPAVTGARDDPTAITRGPAGPVCAAAGADRRLSLIDLA
jgi:hypothetical protein